MTNKKKSPWTLHNIILVALIAIFSGIIFWGAGFLYTALTVALTPIGIAPFANDILMGLWTMAGPLTGYLIKTFGSAFLGEFLGSAVEVFLGGQWGAGAFISGIVQGVGSELGFALTGYKKYGWLGLNLSILTTVVITFAWDIIKNGYGHYAPLMIIGLFITRYISTFIFGGLLTKAITNMLDRSHISVSTNNN
ncbi:ECF transporter S component [Lentilactobacillus sp. SPB1-3]|uniref:ECF transporter S component n=1 Tax=Lentilactobacillus terminaliae TaxID=3003483 RepID=A0ACD5DF76_9LACO|nr:ECF transporter S component [Lentilactobacillus sp. SPB1-3]MCZ0976572.1 ECF transporter S component [Lentilactobacillus sp. SPB1-3]